MDATLTERGLQHPTALPDCCFCDYHVHKRIALRMEVRSSGPPSAQQCDCQELPVLCISAGLFPELGGIDFWNYLVIVDACVF